MRSFQGWCFVISLALVTLGCGKTESTPQAIAPVDQAQQTQKQAPTNSPAATPQPVQKLEGPMLAAYEFLEAIRTGNDERADSLLSTIAREKTAAMDCRIKPPASDTAKFTLDKVDYVGDDGARVAWTWHDVGPDGQPTADKAVWVLRKEAEGWHIVGAAAIFAPGQEPVVLNFEDPADMKKKLEAVTKEMERQQAAEDAQALQAEQQDQPDNSVRR
jgi:hypothetical protein